MTRKAPFRSTLTITLAAMMVLLSVPPDRPAHADGGIVLRPPFDGVRRATAYFDHDEPSYGGGDDGCIWSVRVDGTDLRPIADGYDPQVLPAP